MSEKVIPFYGSEQSKLFEIERRCMDRDGLVIRHLNDELPKGRVLDIGAGNGFTADLLTSPSRTVFPFEPSWEMINTQMVVPWSRGVAQELPFSTHAFDGVYATWAFFLNGVAGIEDGLSEAKRVTRPGGTIVIVDNAGNDEFCALSPRPITSNRNFWLERSFKETIIETSWKFSNGEEAKELLCYFFGEIDFDPQKIEYTYRVAAYSKQV